LARGKEAQVVADAKVRQGTSADRFTPGRARIADVMAGAGSLQSGHGKVRNTDARAASATQFHGGAPGKVKTAAFPMH